MLKKEQDDRKICAETSAVELPVLIGEALQQDEFTVYADRMAESFAKALNEAVLKGDMPGC